MTILAKVKWKVEQAKIAAVQTKVEILWRLRSLRPRRSVGNCIVSLTSYRPRFAMLHLTIKCLLMQTVRPDALELWVSEDDHPHLPKSILDLVPAGLTIRTEADAKIRSYMKLVPAREAHPDRLIATADDDVYYWPTWLEEMLSAYSFYTPELVVCHRAHEMKIEGSLPAPYNTWTLETASNELSMYLFPTGHGGVLYPPGIFHQDGLDREKFKKLSPTADDVWFYWMAAMNGAIFQKIGPKRQMITWRKSQDVGLMHENVFNATPANDRQIGAMVSEYGLPTEASLHRAQQGF